jgi:hypothetical protein
VPYVRIKKCSPQEPTTDLSIIYFCGTTEPRVFPLSRGRRGISSAPFVITFLTKISHWSLSRARSIHSTPLDSSPLITILILFVLLCLILPRDLVSSRVIINHVPECIPFPTYAYNMTRPSHPGEFVAVIIFSWR